MDAAEQFSELFSTVRERYDELDAMKAGSSSWLSTTELLELIEDTQNSLDDVWKADVAEKSAYQQLVRTIIA